MLPVLHSRVSRRRLFEREPAVDHRPDQPRFDERPDILLERRRDAGLALHALGPERRPDDGKPLAHQRIEVDLAFRPFEKGNLGQSALGPERREVALHVAAAHHVEHDIDALAPVNSFATLTKSSLR